MVYNGKYPAFWTGDNHLNENSDRLFQSISIGKETAEYLFVRRMFHKTLAPDEYQLISVSSLAVSLIDFSVVLFVMLDRTYSKSSSVGEILCSSFANASEESS